MATEDLVVVVVQVCCPQYALDILLIIFVPSFYSIIRPRRLSHNARPTQPWCRSSKCRSRNPSLNANIPPSVINPLRILYSLCIAKYLHRVSHPRPALRVLPRSQIQHRKAHIWAQYSIPCQQRRIFSTSCNSCRTRRTDGRESKGDWGAETV